MRLLARLLLALALALGAGQGLSLPAEAPACGCCDTPAEPCPCGPTTPAPAHRAPCAAPANVATPARNAEAAEAPTPRLQEPSPWPEAGRARASADLGVEGAAPRGRDPDLGRHLARLRLLRI